MLVSDFAGIFTPLVTPIDLNGAPDLESMRRLADYQLQHNVHGFWALGTSGEFASFTVDERSAVLTALVNHVNGRVPIVANISDASTRGAIVHGRAAVEAGVQAVAATPPYYYPHSQDELLDHFHRIRSEVDAPLFIYNIPQTVKVRMELRTACALAEDGTAAGIKDSQNDLEWFRALTTYTAQRHIPFAAFAGTRTLIDAAILAGGAGAIPSVANAFPDLAVGAYVAARGGDFSKAAAFERQILDIEAIPLSVLQGSRNAVILAFQKAVLQARGVLVNADLNAPLRSFTAEEKHVLLGRLADLMAV